MEDQQKVKNDRGLVLILGVLGVVIVGLVVSIVMVGLHRDEGTDDGGGSESFAVNNEVAVLNSEIEYKLKNDPDYSFADAKQDYLSMINDETRSNTERLIASYYYASYLNTASNDLTGALEVMKAAERFVGNNKSLEIKYYTYVRQIYYEAGDEAMFAHYNEIVEKLMQGDEVSDEVQ